MTSFVLGPSTWGAGQHTTPPSDLLRHLPVDWLASGAADPSPLDVRCALVGLLREAGYPATMMELEFARKQSGDDNTDLFERIVRELDVDRYLVYLPRGGHLLGIAWELRGLRDGLKARALAIEQVQLFTEVGVAGTSPERGTLEFLELRNRTRYFQDLFHWGCTPRPWSDYDLLRAKILQAAGEDLSE